MRPTVLLFDIDGTLLSSGGAGRHAIVRAFTERYGREDAFAGMSFAGMTDRAIARGGLTHIGRPADEEEIDAALEHYVRCLEEEVARADKYRVHAGMHAAIEAAEQRPRTAVGLGTGNIRKGARVKLARVNLHDRFPFGGFGCDHEDRAELIRMGARRGADSLGSPLADCRVVVIGDTPKDVAAAQAIGAESIAVATGVFTVEQLRQTPATLVVRDLAEPGALEMLLAR